MNTLQFIVRTPHPPENTAAKMVGPSAVALVFLRLPQLDTDFLEWTMDLKLLSVGVLGTASIARVHGWVAPRTSSLPRSTAILVPANTRHAERFRNRTHGCCGDRRTERRSNPNDSVVQRAGLYMQSLFSLSNERLLQRAARFQQQQHLHRLLRNEPEGGGAHHRHPEEAGVGSWLQRWVRAGRGSISDSSLWLLAEVCVLRKGAFALPAVANTS